MFFPFIVIVVGATETDIFADPSGRTESTLIVMVVRVPIFIGVGLPLAVMFMVIATFIPIE
jgi:hypothetical protein